MKISMMNANSKVQKYELADYDIGTVSAGAGFSIGSGRDDFAACNVCGGELSSDADVRMDRSGRIGKLSYCRLCGMETQAGRKFCCGSCEYKLNKFVRSKRWPDANS